MIENNYLFDCCIYFDIKEVKEWKKDNVLHTFIRSKKSIILPCFFTNVCPALSTMLCPALMPCPFKKIVILNWLVGYKFSLSTHIRAESAHIYKLPKLSSKTIIFTKKKDYSSWLKENKKLYYTLMIWKSTTYYYIQVQHFATKILFTCIKN